MAQNGDTERYIPADTNSGWGVIGFVIALAVGCIIMATYFHNTTYKNPTDVTWQTGR